MESLVRKRFASCVIRDHHMAGLCGVGLPTLEPSVPLAAEDTQAPTGEESTTSADAKDNATGCHQGATQESGPAPPPGQPAS